MPLSPIHATGRVAVALVSGGLFGLGLVLSDMVNPGRVRAFLDIAGGAWDPTLAFVMAGALVPMLLAWVIARKRQKPTLGEAFPSQTNQIDRSLIIGAVLFGAGWGMVGFCPGPALAALVVGGQETWIFAAAMAAGMVLHKFIAQRPT